MHTTKQNRSCSALDTEGRCGALRWKSDASKQKAACSKPFSCATSTKMARAPESRAVQKIKRSSLQRSSKCLTRGELRKSSGEASVFVKQKQRRGRKKGGGGRTNSSETLLEPSSSLSPKVQVWELASFLRIAVYRPRRKGARYTSENLTS